MEHYEKMEMDVCEFKKFAKMTTDLMVDSFKWQKLAEYVDDYESKEKYSKVSRTLNEMFLQEHESLMRMYKGE